MIKDFSICLEWEGVYYKQLKLSIVPAVTSDLDTMLRIIQKKIPSIIHKFQKDNLHCSRKFEVYN